jgi:hypothetical protein
MCCTSLSPWAGSASGVGERVVLAVIGNAREDATRTRSGADIVDHGSETARKKLPCHPTSLLRTSICLQRSTVSRPTTITVGCRLIWNMVLLHGSFASLHYRPPVTRILNNTLRVILHLLLLSAYKNNTTTNTHLLNTPYLRYRIYPCDIIK